ncbi:MAG: outer membrane protein assembly factor BamD [Lentisphaerae bacterium]|nr:outer membrane protein assembly factor BamD [Lentisphaerota bacterium]
MQTSISRGRAAKLAGIGLAIACALAGPRAQAARERREAPEGDTAAVASGGAAMEARRLFERGMDLMRAKEADRAVRIFESILEQYPNTVTVYPASLELGRHYLEIRDQAKAVSMLSKLKALEKPDKKPTGEEREWFLEALYLAGVAHFQTRRFSEAFPVLRKITSDYSGTVWANQAYYYIGMCHFVQRNWSKAIDALNMVGAFMDPESATAEYMEAGRRFYLRVEDRDIPILLKLGKPTRIFVTTSRGDREEVDSIPLTADGTVIGSLPTAIGAPRPGDGTLQVVSGDEILSTYLDDTTAEGVREMARTSTVTVVSSGAVAFKLGDYESDAAAAYLGQPCFALLHDADLDVSDESDKAQLTAISRYKQESESEDVLTRPAEEEVIYVTRDQVRFEVHELGTNAPLRTGRFGGKFKVGMLSSGEVPNQDDDILSCEQGDEIVVTYVDTLNIEGPVARTTSATLPVLGQLDSRPRASQDVVFDPVVRSKKNVVEATAYLELARIFRSMGLVKGAGEKALLGLERSQEVVRMTEGVPPEVHQQAYKLTWELHIASDDFANAMAVCKAFNQLYPDSPLVDEALIGMGNIHMENRKYADAISTYRQVLALEISQAKGEAHYRLGEAIEAAGEEAAKDAQKSGGKETRNMARAQAIQEYKLCAERYPDSPFAPQAIAKVVDYYVDSQDFVQAGVLLDQVFTDYPDAPFLDSMYLKWTLVAYQSGDYSKARDKCAQLISEYPESPYAAKAKEILPRIQAKLAGASGTAPSSGPSGE